MPARTCWLLSIGVLAPALSNIGAFGQESKAPADLKAAQAAWQLRNDKVRSFRLTLTEENTTHRGYYLRLPPSRGEKPAAPDSDINVKFSSRVSMKGNNFRYSYSTRRWSPLSRALEPVDYTAVSNPDTRIFLDTPMNPDRRPDAIQSNSRPTSDETVISLVPLMLTVRSGQPYQRKLADYTLTGKMVVVEGRPCVELVRGSRTEEQVEYMYLDPDRNWVIRRIDGYAGDKLTLRISAEYTSDPVIGWFPSNWSYATRSPDGTSLTSGKAGVRQYDINPDIPDAEFRPNYSPGTVVYDDTEGRGGETLSVVKEDGSPGVAISVASHPTITQLEEANRSARRQQVWLLIIGTALAIIFGLVVIRWYRHRQAGRGPATAGPSPQA